jgi:hypothetical protein
MKMVEVWICIGQMLGVRGRLLVQVEEDVAKWVR